MAGYPRNRSKARFVKETEATLANRTAGLQIVSIERISIDPNTKAKTYSALVKNVGGGLSGPHIIAVNDTEIRNLDGSQEPDMDVVRPVADTVVQDIENEIDDLEGDSLNLDGWLSDDEE